MTTRVDINLPPITAYQSMSLFCPERFAVVEASTKAGKTFGCIMWLVTMAGQLAGPGREFWWVAPIYPQATVAYGRTKNMLSEADGARRGWSCNEAEKTITLAGGTVLRFKSADNPDGLYGEDVYAAVIDEASRCKEEAYHAVYSTLTATKGKLRVIGNVKGRKNWAYRLARRAEAGEPGWHYARITAADAVRAGVLSQVEIDSARRDLPEAVFKELYFAEASNDEGNPFGYDHINNCYRRLQVGPIIVYGVDLAKSSDWTVVIGLDEDGNVGNYHRWQGPWSETRRRLVDLIGDTDAAIDSTGVGDPIVEDLQKELPCVEAFRFTSQTKQQIMEGLAIAIQAGEVSFCDVTLRNELEAFEYEYTRTGVRYSAPAGMHDDCVCALALAVHKMRSRIPFGVTVISKPQVMAARDINAVDSFGGFHNSDLSRLGDAWRDR